MAEDSSFPQGQCELKIGNGPEVYGLTSTCSDVNEIEGNKSVLKLARDSRIFFQKGLEKSKLIDGIALIEEVLVSYAEGKLEQKGLASVTADVRRLLEKPSYVFIAVSDQQVKVSFDSSSDALVIYRRGDGSIAFDYVIY